MLLRLQPVHPQAGLFTEKPLPGPAWKWFLDDFVGIPLPATYETSVLFLLVGEEEAAVAHT